MRSYYVDIGQKDVRTGMYDAFDFDDQGIPRYPYDGRPFYNITFICHYALYQLSLYQKYARDEALDRFKEISGWIAQHGDETRDSFVFPYRFEIPGLKPPWISALGQGRMMSVFTRAAEATGEERFLDLARKAMEPFQRSVPNGGVRASFDDGGVAFEEYPRPKRGLVLNGMITALFGLFDLALSGDADARELFDESAAALARNVHCYDLGYWSAYDLTGPVPRVAGDEYHAYHITLLWTLHEMTGTQEFKRMADRWEAYRRGPKLYVMRTVSRINTKLKYGL